MFFKTAAAILTLSMIVACDISSQVPSDPYHQFDCLTTPLEIKTPENIDLDTPLSYIITDDVLTWCGLHGTCDMWKNAALIAPKAFTDAPNYALPTTFHFVQMAQSDTKSFVVNGSTMNAFDYLCVTLKYQAYTYPEPNVTYICPGKIDSKTTRPDAWDDYYGIGAKVRFLVHERIHFAAKKTCHLPADLYGIECGAPQSASTCSIGLTALTAADNTYLCQPHVSHGVCDRQIPPMR